MRGFKYTLFGFVCFFLTASVNMGLAILVYSLSESKSSIVKLIAILGAVFSSAIICTIIDLIRRKVMIEKPLKEILNATELMSRGNFNVRLTTLHDYQDFDEFDYIKDDLNKLAKELSKSEVLKTDFVANVSHEIKTPLSIIQSYTTALDSKSIDDNTRKQYLLNLKNACQRLSILVTNILKLNKLENNKLIPEITRFNLSESLANQILQYEQLIENKKLVLDCDIEDNVYINSEESYLEIIWSNLISNAIKFSEEGGKITISLKKDNSKYIIKVKDRGCGMDAETGEHIFDKFFQGDTSHSKEGNGLGLALVKKVIEILGGSISVDSEVGVGTTFVVIIEGV